MATAIFYGSSTGNTGRAAERILENLGGNDIVDIYNVADGTIEKMSKYEKLIIGTSTWGNGELQDDWKDVFEEFKKIDFSDKTVAFFGLGDQEEYPDEFLSAMGILYEVVASNGAKTIGGWSIAGYYHDFSKAQNEDYFIGLALDEDNQSDDTNYRIDAWCEKIRLQIV